MTDVPISASRLKGFIERIEKLIEERKAIQGDIRDVFSEAKGVGYNVPIMRKVIALRALDAADRAEQETLLDTYMHALEAVDRVQARVAAGESIRAAGAAEGVSRMTAHRLSQKAKNSRNGTGQPETTEAGTPGDDAGHRSEPSCPAEQSVNPAPSSGPVRAVHRDGEGEQSGTPTFDEIAGPIPPALIRTREAAT